MPLNEDVQRPPDQRLILLQADSALQLHQALVALLLDRVIDMIWQRRAGRTQFIAVLKSADAVEFQIARHLQQRLKLFFRFARVADDECRAHGQRRHQFAQRPNRLVNPFHLRGPLHALQGLAVAMLQRDIEIGQHLLVPRHRLHQAPRHITGIGVQDAQPGDARRRFHNRVQQMRQPVFQSQVIAVIGAVLRDQHDFFDAHHLQPHRLRYDRFQRSAHRRALDPGNGAESAGTPATIGDLQISGGALHARSQHAALIAPDHIGVARQMIKRLGMFAPAQPPDEIEDVHPAPRADDAIQPGYLLGKRIAIALRQAAGRDHHLVGALDLHQLAQGINRFFFGRVDEAAGVDDQHLSRAGVADAAHAFMVQHLRHALAVHGVLGAAQAEQVVSVLAFCRFRQVDSFASAN